MPFVEIETQSNRDVEAVPMLNEISALVAEKLGKPESYVMTAWRPTTMSFEGTADPCAMVRVSLIGEPSSEVMTSLNQALCSLLEEHLGVPPRRVFVVYDEVRRSHWGRDGRMLG